MLSKSNILRVKNFTGLLILGLILLACDKDEDSGTGNNGGTTVMKLAFYSLATDKDTVKYGEIATITARASGLNLTYAWSATAGSILGSGNEVSYATGACNAGENVITCKVTDAYNDSDLKTVSIYVAE